MQHADVTIAGAGIIGLATALELAAAGAQVVVFERGEAMRECSWAAAGMLAAGDPENPPELSPLSKFSVRLYPEFLATIERLSGQKVPIRTTQTLQAAHTLPPGFEAVDAASLHDIVPGLHPGGLKFFSLEEQSLDPRDLVRALPEAVKAAGITLLEHTEVFSVRRERDSVHIQTRQGEWNTSDFVNACGAWASDLPGFSGISVFPRKGQILLVESPEPLSISIRTPDVYLVPRGDGRLVIGATVENAGYDRQIDRAAISRLHKAAADLWPPICEARILDSWVGLRPATADSLPVIGPSDAIDGEIGKSDSARIPRLWSALGHFRNGIMLAPGTALLLRQMILGQPLSIDCRGFGPGRLAESFAR